MSFHSISGRVSYISGGTRTGVIELESGGVLLLDCGLDKRNAERIMSELRREGLHPLAAAITHGHADHSRGCSFLKEETDLEIIASREESVFIEHPRLEPRYLFAGARPPKELRIKSLETIGCPVDHKLELKEDVLEIFDERIEAVPLIGHTPGQLGFACGEVFFSGDSFFTPKTLNRHPLPFFLDVTRALETFAKIEDRTERYFVPSHGQIVKAEDILRVLEENRRRIDEVSDILSRILQKPMLTSKLGGKVCEELGIEINNLHEAVVNRTALMAFLSHLKEKGRIKAEPSSEGIVWRAVD